MQLDLFNPIQSNGKTASWNRFYASTLRRLERERKEKEKKNLYIEISIKNLIK